MGFPIPFRLSIQVAALLCLFSTPRSVLADECPPQDGSIFLQYFYGESDTKILRDQQCEDPTGTSHLNSIIAKGECRCYDKPLATVLQLLGKEGDPVSVATRRIAEPITGITCKEALVKCEAECKKNIPAARECATLATPGVSGF